MEKLIINNFAGIKKLTIELNKINLILGHQASGKSVTAKLLFYFKSFFETAKEGIIDNKTKTEIDKHYLNVFKNYFPKYTWANSSFNIEYVNNNTYISLNYVKNKSLKIDYSTNIKSLLSNARKILKEEQSGQLSYFVSNRFSDTFNKLVEQYISTQSSFSQIFIPAGRSFFANIQTNIFTYLHNNQSLDPFLIQFGALYEKFKNIAQGAKLFSNKDADFNNLINKIIFSNYERENDIDYLIHHDKRKVELTNASSGQQEIFPLLLILKILKESILSDKGAVLYIEEPEAHLFPNAQKEFIKLLAHVYNSNIDKFQIIITTHSPYILSSFNNLIYAGYLSSLHKTVNQAKLFSIISRSEIIDPKDIIAYSLSGKKGFKTVMDKSTHLIAQNILDEISDEISTEFGKLMDLEN